MTTLNSEAPSLADKRFHIAHPELKGRAIRADDPDQVKKHWKHLYDHGYCQVNENHVYKVRN